VVKRAVDFRVSAAFWQPWTLVSRNKLDRWRAIDIRVMECIQNQLDDLLDGGLLVLMQGLLRNAIEYGYGFGEIVFQPRYYGQGVSRIKTRPPTYVQLYTDPVDNVERFQWIGTGAWAGGAGLLKYIMAPYPYLRNGNVYGTSDLACIAHDVKILQALEQYQVLGVRNTLVRNILHYFSEGDSDESINAKITKLVSLESGGVLSLPKGTLPGDGKETEFKHDDIEVMDDRASSEALKALPVLLERLEKRITRALGVPDDLGLTTTGVGSLARAEVEMNVPLARIAQDQHWLEWVIGSQLIPAMVRYNFPALPDDYRLPAISFQDTSAGWQSDDADRIMQLYREGFITLQDAQKKLGLAVFTPDEAEAVRARLTPAPALSMDTPTAISPRL
jgi:hypothetical protein